MSAHVTIGSPRRTAKVTLRWARTGAGAWRDGRPVVAWSGQRGPTGVIRRHSVQIGRSHSVHERPVSRSGWR